MAIITNNVTIEEIKEVCKSRYTMPQKSTYFYPKVICGFLFSSIKEAEFQEPVYLHQVVARGSDGTLTRYRDLDVALNSSPSTLNIPEEWRIHFHIPLHFESATLFRTTREDLTGVMDALAAEPSLCSHIEMETYTWEVMPPELKNRSVVDQLVAEYEWTLGELKARGLA